MDKDPSQERVVEYGWRADIDFVQIYEHTARKWGSSQAERYALLIVETAQWAAEGKIRTREVDGHPTFEAALVKWRKAKFGHLIVFRRTDEGIYVLRIMHEAMDIPTRLKGLD